jgi:hypothetical protein
MGVTFCLDTEHTENAERGRESITLNAAVAVFSVLVKDPATVRLVYKQSKLAVMDVRFCLDTEHTENTEEGRNPVAINAALVVFSVLSVLSALSV